MILTVKYKQLYFLYAMRLRINIKEIFTILMGNKGNQTKKPYYKTNQYAKEFEKLYPTNLSKTQTHQQHSSSLYPGKGFIKY